MTAKKNTKTAAPAAKSASKAKKPETASRKSAAKSKTAGVKTAEPASKPVAPAKKRAPAAKKTPAKTKEPATKSKKRAAKAEQEAAYRIGESVVDPIGDVTSGEGQSYLGDADSQAREDQAQEEINAFQQEMLIEASDAPLEAGPGMDAARAAMEARAQHKVENKARAGADRTGTGLAETEFGGNEEAELAANLREPAKLEAAKPEPAKLERLQKILSAAGIASRRSAEEMIVAGRVMVNGQVVTQLGSKADPARDHIRVDGKLLHGAERRRYFLLNKPRGYVTTMSDPEGRPTVMEFFAKLRERVYPVGRLDYQSEGLLLMTNDGELANLLTKAGSGVEKTYLVKVAGQPDAEQLERLRAGVAIEKGEAGSERVRTAPARIRQVREGDNPWFEVVLIEGRNRELRKMFSAIGHFAEKIRRVGYGPLVLDVEPGNMRELTEDEVNALRQTAEGKMKPRRIRAAQMLPKEAGVPAEQRAEKRGSRGGKDFPRRPEARPNPRFDRPQGRPSRDGQRMERPGVGNEKPRWKREERAPKREWRPRGEEFRGAPKSHPEFRGFKPFGPEVPRSEGSNRRPFKPRDERPGFRGGPKQERGENRFGGAQRGPFKSDRPQWKREGETKPRGEFTKRSEFPKRFEGQRGAEFQKGGKFGGGNAKPGFGAKPSRFGKFRGKSGGAKRGFSRPGAQRGGWKRG